MARSSCVVGMSDQFIEILLYWDIVLYTFCGSALMNGLTDYKFTALTKSTNSCAFVEKPEGDIMYKLL